jgi:phage N-6-adenine-methyltransferase
MGKGKAAERVVIEGEGSCFIHGHFFGEECPKCEKGKQQGLAARAEGKVRPLRHRTLQKDTLENPLGGVDPAAMRYANGKMPAQKPGKSEQTVGTPRDFLDAVEKRWGKITFDLAATKDNAVCKRFYSPEDDSLNKKWRKLEGVLWLNPPFSRIEPWAHKCEHSLMARAFKDLLFLVPASVGANWFVEHCYRKALVIFLQGRLTFVGHAQPYPKDMILVDYGANPGFEVWDWRTGMSR